MLQNSLEKNARWLLDTNSIIKMTRWDNEEIFEKIKTLKGFNFISKITVLEYPKSSKIYENFRIIDLNKSITDKALELVLRMRKNGELVPIADVLIMASADNQKIPLIVSDDHHFQILKKYTTHSKKVISFEEFGKKLSSIKNISRSSI
ncbi:MAG: type II toxin-antitoxin system VapC family toxin [Promethearchaeota archaeon]